MEGILRRRLKILLQSNTESANRSLRTRIFREPHVANKGVPQYYRRKNVSEKNFSTLKILTICFCSTLNNYLVWQTVRNFVFCLPKRFRDAYKGLRKALLGDGGEEAQWRYCVQDTTNVLGNLLNPFTVILVS